MGAGTNRFQSTLLWRVLDVLAVLTVVPLLAAAVLTVRSAWRVYHPLRRPVRQTPESFGMTAERVRVRGADGVELACWYIPADGDVGVVLAHGLARNSGMLMPLAKMLHDAGYPVMTYDLRNYGESGRDGLWRGQSPRYSVDHRAVVDHLAGRLAGRPGATIACIGFSTSSWTALEMARLQPELVRAVVCDSGPTLDLPATLARMYAALRPVLPRWLRGPLMFHATRWVFARAAIFFLKPAPWPMELGDHSVRLLFVTGEADPIARPEDLRAQLAWYPEARSWVVPGAGHMQAQVVAAQEYGERVLALLAERPSRTG